MSAESTAPETWRSAGHHWLTVITAIALAVAAILAVLAFWHLPPFDMGVEETDNAYIHGETTSLAAQINGAIVEVDVRDYDHVHLGQVLFRIDDRTYRAKVEQAQANLEAQQAQLANNAQAHAARIAQIQAQEAALASASAQRVRSEADLRRARALVSDGSISKRENDQTQAAQLQAQAAVQQAQSSLAVAREDLRTVDVGRSGLAAQVDAARAALHAAQVDLDYTIVRAPKDGQLSELGVHLGQYVGVGTQLVTLIPRTRWVIADFKEAQTAHIRSQQDASVSVDALGGQRFHGHVGPIAPGTGAEFALIKPDNATGNFVKVPQRIGILIELDPGQRDAERLAPGMSVVARVQTGSSR